MGVRVGALTLYPTGGPYICGWGFTCGGGALSSSFPLAGGGGGRLLLSLFWCDCSALFFFFFFFFLGHLRFSAACHAAGYPSQVPHLADSGWLPYSCGGCLAWGWGCLGTDVLIPHLVFYLVPAQLPLFFFPFGVLHPWRVHQHVFLQSAGLLLGLGWWGLCYVTWFSPMCHTLPQGLQPSQLQATLGFFRSPGVCPSASLVA